MRIFVGAADSYVGRHVVNRLRALQKEAEASLDIVGSTSGEVDLGLSETCQVRALLLGVADEPGSSGCGCRLGVRRLRLWLSPAPW
jgi:hypothetical protein